ncbi:hypothetical protein Q31b_42540 [Novipirellula aureliae]|uniref:Uncharacterized protein n=1 Tax=Novipirellula aureliae TaxID=2527966 RepID=A0A5C6DR36_9BACT|nr:hypothetical protein Q31b_42540 [Novipirellula aureliae]
MDVQGRVLDVSDCNSLAGGVPASHSQFWHDPMTTCPWQSDAHFLRQRILKANSKICYER